MNTKRTSVCIALLEIYEAADVIDPVNVVDQKGTRSLRIPDRWWNSDTFRTAGHRTNTGGIIVLAYIVRRYIEINVLSEREGPLYLSFHRMREDIGVSKDTGEKAVEQLIEKNLLWKTVIDDETRIVPNADEIARITLSPTCQRFYHAWQSLVMG
ncbi:MAG TPA: hypothetical protein VF681_03585 [Abditibacteriaceae bacterium]